MVSFSLSFNKADKKYKAGDIIECKIYVSVFEPFNTRSFSIRFLGVAFTEWEQSKTVSQSGATRLVQEKFGGYEEYFKDDHYFFGNSQAPIREILPGEYNYEATFTLPKKLPSSFDHDYGHIRYEASVTYDVPWQDNYVHTELINVSSIYDLNLYTHLKDPVNVFEHTSFCCWCCTTGPLDIITMLPRSGYVQGQNIPITVEIDNNSNICIDYVYIQLQEILTFKTIRPDVDTKTETEMIKDHMFDTVVARYQNKLFQADLIVDPFYPWKIFDGCEIIKCQYVIKSIAGVGGCHMNPENNVRITIGTVPFIGDTVQELPSDLPTYQEIAIREIEAPPNFEDIIYDDD